MALEMLMPGQGQPQVDPNSTQGVLQHLLGSYGTDEREGLIAQRNQAQQQALQTMHQPLQDQGPVNRMVNDYLMRYGQDPRFGWNAAAQAIGGEGQRTVDMANQQLMRQQTADQEGAKMAAANLQESDLFGGKYMGMLSKTAGKPISQEQLRSVYVGARNEAA